MQQIKHKKWLPIVGGLLAGFLTGLFGSGGGTVIVPFLEECLDQDEHTSHATAILIILCFTIVSLFFYFRHDYLDYKLALWVSIGGVAGGLLNVPGVVFADRLRHRVFEGQEVRA